MLSNSIKVGDKVKASKSFAEPEKYNYTGTVVRIVRGNYSTLDGMLENVEIAEIEIGGPVLCNALLSKCVKVQ